MRNVVNLKKEEGDSMAETKFIQELIDDNEFLRDENRRLRNELKDFYEKRES